MDEYITRNNAISAVCLGCNQQFSDEPCEPSDCTIRRSIMALPTADVVPRSTIDEIFALIWDAFQSTYYDSEFEEKFDEIEKKYTEGQK